jgi:hypothetical protein
LDVGEILEPYWLLDEETNNIAILIEQVSPLIGCWGNTVLEPYWLLDEETKQQSRILTEQVSPLIGCWRNT